LGKKAGPEDTRTQRQRHHDAIEDACRRLIAAGGLPDRAGQPTKIQLHATLDELARLHQVSEADKTSAGDSQANAGQHAAPTARPDPGSFGPKASTGDLCDATIVPIVTGRVDHDLLDQLTAKLTDSTGSAPERGAVRDLILANAVALLSGPGQLA